MILYFKTRFLTGNFFEITKVRLCFFGIRATKGEVIGFGVHDMNNTGHPRFIDPSSRFTCKLHRRVGPAMIAAIAAEYFVASSVLACSPEGVFICVSPSKGKKERVDIARNKRGEQLTKFGSLSGRGAWVDIDQFIQGLLHGGDNFGMVVSDMHTHQLAVKVEKALAFGRPKVHPFSARNGERIDVMACAPVVEGVFLT